MTKYLIIILLLAMPVMAQTMIALEKDNTHRNLITKIDRDGKAFSVSAWGDECNLSIDISDGREHRVYKRDDGNLEWEVILQRRPFTSTFIYPIETKGLRFTYQDTLMDTEKEFSGRPDSVIGSYAVYHESKKGNCYRANGKLKYAYMAGKAFHIYRPKISDRSGKWVWGDLYIDIKYGYLAITIPEDFLKDAEYPVIIDPTFGTTGIGASTRTMNPNWILHNQYTMNAEAGTVDSLTVYTDSYQAGNYAVGAALYSDNSDDCNTLLDSSTVLDTVTQYTDQWNSFVSAESYSLVASTKYWITMGVQNTGVYARYDDNNADTSDGKWTDPWPYESACQDGWATLQFDYAFSMYITYSLPISGQIIMIMGD